MGDRAVLIVKAWNKLTWVFIHRHLGGHFKILIPRGQRPFYIMYCQNSLKSNNGLSRIIYISLNGLYGGYLKTIAFILACNVEYRN